MKRTNEILVGMIATAALVLAVIGSLYLARGGLQPGYALYAKFTWGAGLKQGQPVLLSGVNVGYVHGVQIRPDGLLIVELRVRKEFRIPLGTTATIEPNGFFGDQLVALHPDKPNPSSFSPGDTLLAGRATPSIGDVLARVDTIAGNISVLTTSLKKQFVETNGFADLRHTIKTADALMVDLSALAAEQRVEIKKTEVAAQKALSALDSAAIDSTLRSFKGAATNLDALAADLKATSAKLNTTLDKVNSGDGSMAKLMNDPALYNNVTRLVARIDSLTADFKANPKKYIKLSIF
ncbi:MAG TPA: MlaD family protein [Gemmatimonadaceae bacterium]|jgi:phospholipid/cholesterol/gamma-HCH transport system substrate-binding protein